MKAKLNRRYINYIIILMAGLVLGWILFHDRDKQGTDQQHRVANEEAEVASVWTCSMHPHIRMDQPGDCPICGMDLIPVNQLGETYADPDAVHLSKEAAQLANVMTSVASRKKPVKEIRLYGSVSVDERLLQSQVAHVPGRIDRLNVNFTGEQVKQGQVLAEIYSPELITARQELLQTLETRQLQPELYEASRERLSQWKLTDEQIDEIEDTEKIMSNIKVYSGTSGTVISRNVNSGDYVSQGAVLYEIADLSKVWVLFDAYESDLPFLERGTEVRFTLQALPGKEYSGKISFIDPVVDPVTRVASVRVDVQNKTGVLKPGMFVTGIVSSELDSFGNEIVIPHSAVLWTGKRSIVYVKEPGDEMIFKMREIELGPELGDSYVVTEGLSEGEVIVTNGTFSVDASAQLEGKPSMMNPSGGMTSQGHQHGDSAPANIEDVQKPSGNLEVNSEFTNHLANLYESYLEIKNALVGGDAGTAAAAASKMKSTLSKIDMKLIEGEAHEKWMDISGGIAKYASAISASEDIEVQRTSFFHLSGNMYTAVKSFTLPGRTVYHQFCPMAFNNKGAYWLSELEEIRNPYFGDMMLTCGETKETIK
jgi:membrane fusion protein, copper/silver efflux system